jgi:F-type H+-transporting ATPase subunit b
MFLSAEFWVLVAFLIFMGILVYFGVPATILGALDNRTKRVSDELAEAQRLREEAARLLKEYERKRLAAEQEAADIVAAAREEAERLGRESEERLADFVRRRTAAAEAKIAQAEAQATAEVRAAAADAAVRASERVLRAELSGGAGDDLVSRGLSEIRAKLNA